MSTAPLLTDEIDVYGPMVARSDVANAVLDTLQSNTTGLIFYIAERERRTGLPPRTLPIPANVSSYRGGLDFETYGSDEFPLIVVVAQREGSPERHESGQYAQWFEVQIAALVEHQSEPEALDLADHYGIALALCVLQNPEMGGLAVETRLETYPVTEFANVDRRTLTRSVLTVKMLVEPVFGERFGPWPAAAPGPPPNPYAPPADYPEVREIEVTLTAQPLSEQSGSAESTTVVVDQG